MLWFSQKLTPHSTKTAVQGCSVWVTQADTPGRLCLHHPPVLRRQIELISFHFFKPCTWSRCLLSFSIMPAMSLHVCNTNSPFCSLNLVLLGVFLFHLSSEVCMFTHSGDEIAAPKRCLWANKLFGKKWDLFLNYISVPLQSAAIGNCFPFSFSH